MPASDDSRTPEPQEANRAWEEANAWLLRVHSGIMSEQEHQDFTAWRRRDAAHEFQFRQAERFWQALNGLASQVRREPLPREVAAPSSGTVPLRSGLSTLSRHKPRWGTAVAAALVLAVFSPLIWSTVEFWSADHHTFAGQQSTVSLADGSRVYLNTRSALSVNLSERRRSLSLKQGEALFEVAHDPGRPFEVAVNGRVVRAIGTVFNIAQDGHRTSVSVLDGAVRLLDGEHTVEIRRGERVMFGEASNASAPEPFNASAVTAWRRQELIFDQMPLGDIVAQMNRYRTDTIVVLGSSLRTQRLSGSLGLQDSTRALSLLQQTLPFHITHVTPYLTILSL